ncbi:hypothetical protein M422DRAFT_150875 [Sphaerobolus stellatus SS14]|nr:hypothetical protein M422DRAFT_150875 [Sphaerobolus stellatus SS14]
MENVASSNKTIVILGASYGGAHAAQILAAGLPDGWRIVLIDRNSHINHVYVMPRFAVLPGHEYKAFIPYDNVFLTGPNTTPHIHLHAHVVSLTPKSITLSKAFPELGIPSTTLPYDYAVYALGSQLPPPLNLWGENKILRVIRANHFFIREQYHGLKSEAIEWLKEHQKTVEGAPSILVVGGGALGVQYATDIANVYPSKKVTLLHSRLQLLPRFDKAMHDEIYQAATGLGIEVILGERLDLSSVDEKSPRKNPDGQRIVTTVSGRELAADLLLLCTGQTPNTDILRAMDPATVNPQNRLAHILRTMQIGALPLPNENEKHEELLEKGSMDESTPYPNIFAIGDAANAFGAIAAGHTAYFQAEVAARNILRLIKKVEAKASNAEKVKEEPLETYTPGAPGIKVSLGLRKAVVQHDDKVEVWNNGKDDLDAAVTWKIFGYKVEKDEDMYP